MAANYRGQAGIAKWRPFLQTWCREISIRRRMSDSESSRGFESDSSSGSSQALLAVSDDEPIVAASHRPGCRGQPFLLSLVQYLAKTLHKKLQSLGVNFMQGLVNIKLELTMSN